MIDAHGVRMCVSRAGNLFLTLVAFSCLLVFTSVRPVGAQTTLPSIAVTFPGGNDSGSIYVTHISANPSQLQLMWTQLTIGHQTPPSGMTPTPTNPYATAHIYIPHWNTLWRIPDGGTGTAIATSWTLSSRTNGSPLTVGIGDEIATAMDTTWSPDIHYGYYLTGTQSHYVWDPDGFGSGHWEEYTTGTPTTLTGPTTYVTIRKVAATANQTVDTRIDPRYDLPPLKDHQFDNTLYRGGLFVGYNADNSRVARTYLGFTSLPGPLTTGEALWAVGGMSVCLTRMAKTGSATIMCRTTSATWDPATLVWSNAPAADGVSSCMATVSWASTTPLEQWTQFYSLTAIDEALRTGASTLSFVLSASSEGGSGTGTTADNGWAYFARNNYAEPAATTTYTDTLPLGQFHPGQLHGQNMAAYLLYAYGGSGPEALNYVGFSPTTVAGPCTATGTVSLNFVADVSQTVTLTSGNTSLLGVPATVTIPAGSSSATFTGTFSSVTTTTTVTISATTDNGSVSSTVTITPPTAGGPTGGGGAPGGGGPPP